MLRMGMMIRSAKMKLITPPKLMPPFHSTTASGMLPTEQTKLSSEMIGATIGSQKVLRPGWWVKNRDCQKLFGTHAESAPAMRKPSRSEEHTSELQSHHDLVCRLL